MDLKFEIKPYKENISLAVFNVAAYEPEHKTINSLHFGYHNAVINNPPIESRFKKMAIYGMEKNEKLSLLE